MKKDDFINPAFEHFDVCPSSAYVDIKVVKLLLACSDATIWRDVKSGRLPKPHKLSLRNTRWNVGELREALALKGGE